MIEAGDAADGQKGDILGADAVMPGGEGMTELVEHDDGEHAQHKENPFQGIANVASEKVVAETHPAEENQEGEVKPEADPGDLSKMPGRVHGRPPSGCVVFIRKSRIEKVSLLIVARMARSLAVLARVLFLAHRSAAFRATQGGADNDLGGG